MKKLAKALLLAALLAIVVSVFAIPVSAEDNLTAYIKISSGSVQFKVPITDFEVGAQYKLTIRMKCEDFEAGASGGAFSNFYPYSDNEGLSFVANFDAKLNEDDEEETVKHLIAGEWIDWASITGSHDWQTYEYTFTAKADYDFISFSTGMWGTCTCILSMDDFAITKVGGTESAFSEDWENGIDTNKWASLSEDDEGTTEYTMVNYTAPVESKDESKEDNADTGDNAIVFAVLAVISLAGAVIVKKVRQ